MNTATEGWHTENTEHHARKQIQRIQTRNREYRPDTENTDQIQIAIQTRYRKYRSDTENTDQIKIAIQTNTTQIQIAIQGCRSQSEQV